MFLARTMHRLTLLIVVGITTAGCAQLRIPAFDPSGERIFSGHETAVALPAYRDIVPTPAFPNVAASPPCPGRGGAQLCGSKTGSVCPAAQMRDRSYVVMMPGRVVAPVGSEVIVVSGICGEGGNYVMRQPLEWLLAPDSVGHIVQVGNNKHCFLTDWFTQTASYKVDNEYAKNKTRTHKDTITRGNKNPGDDVVLGKGQSWVSVMSPTEGASHVTVLAPTEENWDHRRQTATIYWVDAQWTLPPPTIVRIDRREPAVLNTLLARAQNIGPIEGWLVRYETLDGPVALFENGQRTIEIPSDINGNATAHLTPQTGEAGITQVGVQIIRPANKGGDYPRMVVGQGLTSAAWSAPGIVVRPIGPATADADQPTNYRIEVANTGDVLATDVLVTYRLPEGCSVVSTNPPAQPFGDRLEWRIGDLPAKQAPRVIDLTLTMRLQARYEHCFRAVSLRSGEPIPELQANGCVSTIVNRSALIVRMTGPQSAPVGSEVKFLAEIENTSSLPATNVTVKDAFDPGLQHVRGSPSPIVMDNIGTLEPGQKIGVTLTFNVLRPGTHCHRLQVTADGGVSASTEGCIVATAGQAIPRLEVRMTGPDSLKAGEEGLYVIEVRNSSTVPLTNLRITNRYSASLFPRQASSGWKLSPGEVYWEWPELAAGDAVSFEFRGLARRADPNAVSVGIVTADPGLTQQAQAATRIIGEGDPAAVGPAAVPPVLGQRGGLKLEIDDNPDPVNAGDTITYRIGIRNQAEEADQNIVISFELPPGLSFQNLRSGGEVQVRAEGKSYVIAPINKLDGNETFRPLELRVRAEKPGKYQMQVKARSMRQPEGVIETESTDVIQP